MKILVTGGTVFVSKFIAEYFSDKGNEVYVINRNTRPQLRNVQLIECDRNKINGKLKGICFDTVIDVTAYTAYDINTLLDELGIFENYIMISSSAVYPETLPRPFKERYTCGNNKYWGDYGVNKIDAENALLKRVRSAFILRPPYLYGEYNNIYREAFVFDCAERNAPFYLPKDGLMPLQFLHVEDLCRFIEIILKNKPRQRIFNVGDRPCTVSEWVDACYSAAGAKPVYINVPDNIEQRNYFPFYNYAYELDITAQNLLMPDRLPLYDGLKRAYRWYKENREQVKKKSYFEYILQNLK